MQLIFIKTILRSYPPMINLILLEVSQQVFGNRSPDWIIWVSCWYRVRPGVTIEVKKKKTMIRDIEIWLALSLERSFACHTLKKNIIRLSVSLITLLVVQDSLTVLFLPMNNINSPLIAQPTLLNVHIHAQRNRSNCDIHYCHSITFELVHIRNIRGR